MFPLSTAIAAACSSGSSRTSHFPAPSRIPKPVVVPSSVKTTKIRKKRRDVGAVIFFDVPCAERMSHHLAGFICVLLFTSIRNRNANSQTERTPGRLVIGVQLPVCALYLFPFVQHYGIDVVRV